jgi:hypothetical protein
MQAIAYSRYGSPEVLGTVTLPRPDPKPGEVLVRIRATTVTAGDYRARSLDMPPGFGLVGRLVFGLLRPQPPGSRGRVLRRGRGRRKRGHPLRPRRPGLRLSRTPASVAMPNTR